MVAKLNLDDMFNQGLFQHPSSLGNSLEEVRNSIRNFKLDSSGIDILSFQPGVGKTHLTNELLKDMDSYLVVTGSHKLLTGEYSDLKATKHWERFKDKCENYNSYVQRLDKLGVSKKFICNKLGCDKRKCPYWKQFNTKKAIAPYHFLSTDRVLDKDGNFKFEMLVVDEAMDDGTEYNLDEESLTESIEAMSNYEDVQFLEQLNWEENLFDYIQGHIHLLNSKRYGALEGAISEKEWDDAKKIAEFRPYNLIRYYYYQSIYGNSSSYYEPLLYTIFDYARQKIPIILLDASFDINAYEVTLGRYNFEHKSKPRDLFIEQPLGPLTELSTMIYGSNISDKHKIIYRMKKDNFYYKKGFFNNKKMTQNGNQSVIELKKFIKRAKRQHNNIGIITYLHLEPYFMGLGETEHFFNLRGSNKLKKVDALFIIGTPQKKVSDILYGYNKLCLTDFTEESIYKPIYKIQDGMNCIYHKYVDCYGKHEHWDCNIGNGYKEKKPVSYRFKGDYDDWYLEELEKQHKAGEIDLDLCYKFSDYSMNQDESEKYQAIHRARPFNNDNPVIYVFGDIPEQIKEEFNVISLDNIATQKFFNDNYRGVYPWALWSAIISFFSKTGSTSEEIAKKLKIYKKDKKSYNTSFITNIISGINLKDVKRIDKYLKEHDSVTLNDIKRKYRNLSIEDDMIDYFIFYASEECGFISV